MISVLSGIQVLKEKIESRPTIRLLVVDTMGNISSGYLHALLCLIVPVRQLPYFKATLMLGDENDAKKGTTAAGLLIEMVQQLAWNIAVLGITHTTKSGVHGGWHENQGPRITAPKLAKIRGTGGLPALCRAAHSITFAGGDPAHKNKRIFFNVRNSFRFEGLASPICFEKTEDGVIRECAMVPFYQPAAATEATKEQQEQQGPLEQHSEEEEEQTPEARPIDHWLHGVLARPIRPADLKDLMANSGADSELGFDAELEFNNVAKKRNLLVPIDKFRRKPDRVWMWKLKGNAPSLPALPSPIKRKVATAVATVQDSSSEDSSEAVGSYDYKIPKSPKTAPPVNEGSDEERPVLVSSSSESHSDTESDSDSDSDSDGKCVMNIHRKLFA